MQNIIQQTRQRAYARLEGRSEGEGDVDGGGGATNPLASAYPYDYDVGNHLRSQPPGGTAAHPDPQPPLDFSSTTTSPTDYYYDESNKNSSARNSVQNRSTSPSSSLSNKPSSISASSITSSTKPENSLFLQVEKQWREGSASGDQDDDDENVETPKYGSVRVSQPVYSSVNQTTQRVVHYDDHPLQKDTHTNSSVVAVSSQQGHTYDDRYDSESNTFDYAGKTRELRASFETLTNDDGDDGDHDDAAFLGGTSTSQHRIAIHRPHEETGNHFIGGFYSKSNPNAFRHGHPVTMPAPISYPPAATRAMEYARGYQQASLHYQQESYKSSTATLPQYTPSQSRHGRSTSDLTLHDADAEAQLDRKGKEGEEEEEEADVSSRELLPKDGAGAPGAQASDQATEDYDEFLIDYKPTDAQHPYSWTLKKKWSILAVVWTAALCVTATSSIQASTYNSIQAVFGIERVTAVCGVSLYVLGFGIGALFLGPTSEFIGRRLIYITSFALFTVLNVPIAVAQNITVFLIFRFITGLCGSGFLAIAGGTVTDMFPPGTTDIPVAVYTLSPLLGPCLGPLIGGFINQNVTWRVTFYVIVAWSGVEFFLLYFFVPETFLPILQKNEAKRKRIKTGIGKYISPVEKSGRTLGDVFPKALYIPIQLMLTEKMALALDLWTSLILGIIYLFFNAIPFTFRTVFGFNLQSTGLAFVPMGAGMILATISQVFWVKEIKNKAALNYSNGGKAPPESRLLIGMAGAVLVPAGLLWFALSSNSKTPWFMPMLGTVVFGCGAVYVFTSVFGFLVSTYPKYAASAMAGNTLIRCVWAAAFPLFADPMYRKLGPIGATSLLAGLTIVMAPIPFVLYRVGPKLRAASKYSK